MKASFPLSEEKFVRLCAIRKKEAESVSFKTKGRWASEETMRDVLKFKETLGFLLEPLRVWKASAQIVL